MHRSCTLRVLTWVSPALVLVLCVASLAGPDGPSLYEPPLAVYSGNQSEGIWSVGDSAPLVISVLRVEDLTQDIAPAAGTMGVSLWHVGPDGGRGSDSNEWDVTRAGSGGSGGTGANISLTLQADPWGVVVSGRPERDEFVFGLYLHSAGGKGGRGGDGVGVALISPGLGGHGGHGGNGGDVNITSSGSITSTVAYWGPAIFGWSNGARGGDGGGGYYGIWSNGGDGGRGGRGGNVVIESASAIETIGRLSPGISAASKGAIGGQGGTAVGPSATSGTGGVGGAGGAVTVGLSGSILTQGDSSRGILAQSMGGDSGQAGGGKALLFWGGGEHSSGNGGSVAIATTPGSAIWTRGGHSSGIEAQSIGGGGGSGGSVGGLIVLGGSGSATGHGGAVTVDSAGAIFTEGPQSVGILAQSIGGGGGTARSISGLVSIGGDGNASGHGGSVLLANQGPIMTLGEGSGAIVAQSIGGGGGLLLSPAGSGDDASGYLIAHGGRGTSGGNGGIVTVHNSGDLYTQGVGASGILAESIGGGGGEGGGARGVGYFTALTRGGQSGAGGSGAAVQVHSDAGAIFTAGALSHGVHAVSIGGGGGTGGEVYNYVRGLHMSSTLGLGGDGGSGGTGGNVGITSHSPITTLGDHAHGLYAESIGGGGGSGGAVINWVKNVDIGFNLPSVAITVATAVGGTGGSGGSGAEARVQSYGDIDTTGFRSYGVTAQSVGGGGGDGGNSMAGMLTLNTYSISAVMGGSGGAAGDGGLAVLDSRGDITTQGDFAYGIMAQSVGGGGGSGGNSSSLILDIEVALSVGPEDLAPVTNATVALGGSANKAGRGGNVDARNAGAILTSGHFAHGMLAHSIGGGGGAAGDALSLTVEYAGNPLSSLLPFLGCVTAETNVVLGGSAGKGGYAGDVLARNVGSIHTQGAFASGIVAQSVGGGGGTGGVVRHDFHDLISSDSSSRLQTRSGGDGGDGYYVRVINSGQIVTQGAFAHGIVAQSIGGGGGLGGISETTGLSILELSPFASGISIESEFFGVGFAGSAGGWGMASSVRVEHSGSITTQGDASHGILAQSLGRNGSDTVSVIASGDIHALGMDSIGIYAQSNWAMEMDDISIVIQNATIRGGSGSGAGVRFEGRVISSLTNAGGTISALSGTAIVSVGGEMHMVWNRGRVVGNVLLGGNCNEFYNETDGRLDAGAMIDLRGGDLWNSGVVSPGGAGAVQATEVRGFLNDLGGRVEMDLAGVEAGEYDTLEFSGGLRAYSPLPIRIDLMLMESFGLAPFETVHLPLLYVSGAHGASWALGEVSGAPAHYEFEVLARGDHWVEVQITNTIPLPGTLLLTAVGMGMVLKLRRRR